MMRRASSYPESFTLWIHSVLRIEKKFSAKALSYGLPRLDIDGVMGRYFDTCYTYLNGCSEKAVKECLVQRHPPFLIIAQKNESRLFSCLLSFYICTMQSAVLFIYLRIGKSAGKTDFRYTF